MSKFPIITKLGGRHAVAQLVRRSPGGESRPITRNTVRMWETRGRIPGYAVAQMMAEAERRSIRIDARDLVAETLRAAE